MESFTPYTMARMLKLFLIPIILGATLFGEEISVVRDQGKTHLDAQKIAQIPVRMKSYVDQGTIAGAVTLVARHGVVAALDSTGYTDMETRQPMKTDAIFQLHSMTKPIVAIGAMILVEEGKIAINDPVEKYLPEFRGMWVVDYGDKDRKMLRRPSRVITIRDLMTHTSGLPLNPPAGIGELHGALHKTLNEVILVISQQPLAFDPGTRWMYSNTGIAALARVIEVVSGTPYEMFLEQRIFKPLGMKDTHTFPPKEKFHRMPTAYILREGKTLKYTSDPLGEGAMKFRENAKYPLPEGGLYSTASDLFILCQMMLSGGEYKGVRILSPASVEVMTTVHTGDLKASAPGLGAGLGWTVVRNADAGPLSLGTFGHGGRYGTYFFVDRKRDMLGIFLIHREGGSEEKNAFVSLATAAAID